MALFLCQVMFKWPSQVPVRVGFEKRFCSSLSLGSSVITVYFHNFRALPGREHASLPSKISSVVVKGAQSGVRWGQKCCHNPACAAFSNPLPLSELLDCAVVLDLYSSHHSDSSHVPQPSQIYGLFLIIMHLHACMYSCIHGWMDG